MAPEFFAPGASLLANAASLQASALRAVADAQSAALESWRSATRNFTAAAVASPVLRLPNPAQKIEGTPADVKVGTEVSYTREVTPAEILAFANACGDVNPVHFDDEYAKRNTSFGGVIAHGLLTASFVSSALSRLPGVVIYLEQDLRFVKPVRPGDVVTARVLVTERPEGKSWMRLKTTCVLADGSVALEGHAKILLLPEKA